jgi:two-component system, NarL family, response regulator NreC
MVTTIVLADDHPIVRQGLRTLLEAERDFSVVGEAADGHEAITLAIRLRPALVIVDLKMPKLDGLEVCRRVRDGLPHTRVLILSMYANAAYVTEAFRRGATGYVLKETDTSNLVEAVREVQAGGRYVSPPVSDLVLAAYLEKTQSGSVDPYDALTAREREILRLVVEGRTNAEIAAQLAISPRTVETHRTHLMRKLGLRTPTDLVRYGLRRGIVPLEQ